MKLLKQDIELLVHPVENIGKVFNFHFWMTLLSDSFITVCFPCGELACRHGLQATLFSPADGATVQVTEQRFHQHFRSWRFSQMGKTPL